MTPCDRARQHRLFAQRQAEVNAVCDEVYRELWDSHKGWWRRKRTSRTPRKQRRAVA